MSENLVAGDEEGNTLIDVVIEPNLRLKPEQKAIIEVDFRMEDEEAQAQDLGAADCDEESGGVEALAL